MSQLKHHKMKKSILVILTVFLKLALYSCNPEQISEETYQTQACCGEGDPNDPPPLPSPKDTVNGVLN